MINGLMSHEPDTLVRLLVHLSDAMISSSLFFAANSSSRSLRAFLLVDCWVMALGVLSGKVALST